MVSLASQLCDTGDSLPLSSEGGLTGRLSHPPNMYMGSGAPDSNPHTCTASTLFKTLFDTFTRTDTHTYPHTKREKGGGRNWHVNRGLNASVLRTVMDMGLAEETCISYPGP